MRSTRRRARIIDPLATPDAVRSICSLLRERLPHIIPQSEKLLTHMLEAVRYIERRPATDTKRGRPSRWPRENLLEVARQLRDVLNRETSGRISLHSFIGQYLRILHFPADVVAALKHGDINLQEAIQLARLTSDRLGCSLRQARELRIHLLQSHMATQGSQTQLRVRVKETLGENVEPSSAVSEAVAIEKVDELLEMDPLDSTHLFYEELRRIGRAIREIQPEELTDKVLGDLMPALDQLSAILHGIETKRRKREPAPQRIEI
jgi:hypothetical protein